MQSLISSFPLIRSEMVAVDDIQVRSQCICYYILLFCLVSIFTSCLIITRCVLSAAISSHAV